MSRLVMNLRNVPDDEADEVRALLDEHGIEYYETQPGPFGISMGAIWLRDESRAEEADRLFREYQAERRERMRSKYLERLNRGEAEGIIDRFRQHPLRNTAFVLFAAALLYIMTRPFFLFAG